MSDAKGNGNTNPTDLLKEAATSMAVTLLSSMVPKLGSIVPTSPGAAGVPRDAVESLARTLSAVRAAIPVLDRKVLTIPAGTDSASTAADEGWANATLLACTPVSGNDRVLAGVYLSETGAVTVRVCGAESGDASFLVLASLPQPRG